MKRRLVLAALALLLPAVASADPISAFSLFGGNMLSLGASNTLGGLAGSNGIVALQNGGSNILTLEGGGTVSTSGGASTITGNIISNSNVILDNNGHVTGGIDSGGNVTLGSNVVVDGNIRAGGTLFLNNNAVVHGNVDVGAAAGAVVTLNDTLAHIDGTVTHKAGTTITDPGVVSVGGNVIGVPAAPTAYSATSVPAATPGIVSSSLAADSRSIANFGSLALAPGTYNDLSMGSSATLQLSAGTYYFDTWTLDNNDTISFIGGGLFRLFFTGNVFANSGLIVNDGTVSGNPNANNIYAETLGNWSDRGEWIGTIFGSGGSSNVSFGPESSLTGVAWARNNLITDQHFTQTNPVPFPNRLPCS